MRPARTLAFGVFSFASVALAGDPQPPRHDVTISERWEAGETSTETTAMDIRVVANAPGVEADREQRTTVKTTIVRKCVEAGPAGELRRAIVHVASWSHAAGGEEDTSLEGALVETTPEGWTLLACERAPSRAALQFLDRNVGGRALTMATRLGAGCVRRDVAVGESWAPDDTVFAALTGNSCSVSPSDLGMKFTLESYEPADGALRIGISAHSTPTGRKKDPSGTTLADLREGSVISAKGSIAGASSRWQRDGAFALRLDSHLLAEHRKGTLTVDSAMDFSVVSRAGGEVPAPPEERAGAVRFARAASWKRGDAVTETGSVTFASSTRDVSSDGKAGPAKGDVVTLAWTAVRRCVETSASAEPAAFEVWFRAWKRCESGTNDECLAGAVVDVRGSRWSVRDGRTLTAGARKWLTAEYGSAGATAGDEPVRALVTPVLPVAPGDGWEPDPEALASIARGWIGLPVDAAAATASATLERADAAGASIAWSLDAPVRCVAGCRCRNAEVLQGGRVKLSGTATGNPADWTRHGTSSDRMETTVALPGPDDGAKRVSIVQTRTRSRVPGGDFPSE